MEFKARGFFTNQGLRRLESASFVRPSVEPPNRTQSSISLVLDFQNFNTLWNDKYFIVSIYTYTQQRRLISG